VRRRGEGDTGRRRRRQLFCNGFPLGVPPAGRIITTTTTKSSFLRDHPSTSSRIRTALGMRVEFKFRRHTSQKRTLRSVVLSKISRVRFIFGFGYTLVIPRLTEKSIWTRCRFVWSTYSRTKFVEYTVFTICIAKVVVVAEKPCYSSRGVRITNNSSLII